MAVILSMKLQTCHDATLVSIFIHTITRIILCTVFTRVSKTWKKNIYQRDQSKRYGLWGTALGYDID